MAIDTHITALHHEIMQQPEILAGLSSTSLNTLPINLENVDWIVGIGEGSSLHALELCHNAFIRATGKPCLMLTPDAARHSLLASSSLNPSRILFILVSQSGNTHSLVQFLNDWQDHWSASHSTAQSAETSVVLLTNTLPSALSTHPAVQLTLPILAGTELSIAATKTLTNTVGRLLQILDTLYPRSNNRPPRIQCLLDGLYHALQNEKSEKALYTWIGDLVKQTPLPSPFVLLAPNPWLPVLEEIQLKWMEITGLSVHAYSYEAFLHGPRALLEPQLPEAPQPHVLVWNCPDFPFPEPLFQQCVQHNVSLSVLQYQTELKVFTPQPAHESLILANYNSQIHPHPQPTPFLTIAGSMLATGQRLALNICQHRGFNPNHPLLTKAVVSPSITDV